MKNKIQSFVVLLSIVVFVSSVVCIVENLAGLLFGENFNWWSVISLIVSFILFIFSIIQAMSDDDLAKYPEDEN